MADSMWKRLTLLGRVFTAAIVVGSFAGFFRALGSISQNHYWERGYQHLSLLVVRDSMYETCIFVFGCSVVLLCISPLFTLPLWRRLWFYDPPGIIFGGLVFLIVVASALLITFEMPLKLVIASSEIGLKFVDFYKEFKIICLTLGSLLAGLPLLLMGAWAVRKLLSRPSGQNAYDKIVAILPGQIIFMKVAVMVKAIQKQVVERVRMSFHSPWLSRIFVVCAVILLLIEVVSRSEVLAEKSGESNIVLITIDTVRADHLGCYGSPRSTSPNLDYYASRGLLFQNPVSQAPWTLPSLSSILTSLYPMQHNAFRIMRILPPAVDTVAEILRNHAFRTYGVVSGSIPCSPFGLSQGFAEFHKDERLSKNYISSPTLTQKTIKLLGQKTREPFFLCVHYFDPHYSYIRHPQYGFAEQSVKNRPDIISYQQLDKFCKQRNHEVIDYINDTYDEELAFTDDSVGKLARHILQMSLQMPTHFIYTADHGEYLMDRGKIAHGRDVYHELIHVPLIIFSTDRRKISPTIVTTPVETSYIPTTIATLTGIGRGIFQGENLLNQLDVDSSAAVRFTEGEHASGPFKPKIGIFNDHWKMIYNLNGKKYELYDLEVDPVEKHNLINQNSAELESVKAKLSSEIDAFQKLKRNEEKTITLNENEREELRALGYLE